MVKQHLLFFIFLLIPTVCGAGYDLVVYGGSSAGIAAAVQVKRMGGSVIVIEPTRRVGGLTTGGLGATDIGNKRVIGGISREFYQAVRKWYSKKEAWKWMPKPSPKEAVGTGQSRTEPREDTQWVFEPSVALSIYREWIRKNDIPVVHGERLDRVGERRAVHRADGWWVAPAGKVSRGVVKDGNRITAIVMESGKRFAGKMFMDATYEGDLMASAGVSYTIGREGRGIYGESFNGVQTERSKSHQLFAGVDPYVKKGDKASGLLPGVDSNGPGKEFGSDHRIQAYCFRMCLTDHPKNRIPFKKPTGYDESWYELLFRNYEAGFSRVPWGSAVMPNRKTDTNNRDGVSTDFIGQNYAWPEGSYAERNAIRDAHLTYQQGLVWTLANHPRVPVKIRAEVSRWGVTRDEFTEGAGWPEQLYVREGRRMISGTIMTQRHCQHRETVSDSVGMGAYNMDSHNTQRYVTALGHARNEGNIEERVKPYPISYRSIVPKKEECANLVVPVALGASHIAFGSIRMEPVFMILGQSGGTAVMQALREGKALQDIDYTTLRMRLLADGQILEYPAVTARSERQSAGIVIDDKDAVLTGNWTRSQLARGVNQSYFHDGAAADGKALAVFRFQQIPAAASYSVQIASSAHPNRSSRTLVCVEEKQIRINQKKEPPVENLWIPVAVVHLKKGASLTVAISNAGADGHVIVDAVRLVPVRK
jgi:hypothetical protein